MDPSRARRHGHTDRVSSIAKNKAELRRRMRSVLGAVPQTELARASAMICQHLMRSDELTGAHTILAFAPLPGEVDLGVAMRWAIGRGAAVCLPRMDWDAHTMAPARIERWGAGLTVRRHGVAEPGADAPIQVLRPGDVVLVPGLAFDRAGGRLGRGAGFYDRFLAGLPAGVATLGVGLGCQIIERVPMEVHDRLLDAILHEGGCVD